MKFDLELLLDGTVFMEVYDADGSMVASGTASQISKELGLSYVRVRMRSVLSKEGHSFRDGLDFVDVGVLRFVYDLYMGGSYIGQGTIDELSALTGLRVSQLRYLTTPSYHAVVAKSTKESKARILYRHDEPRLDYY